MFRSVLFTGCAADRDGVPPIRQATIALARALRLELWEAPASGCCGARPDRLVGAADLRRALAPLAEGAHQGLDVVCLSPACRRVVATHVTTAAPDAPAGGAGSAAPPPHVRDVVHVLTQADGLERLARVVRKPLAPLRVALHGTCHADHRPPAPATPGTAPEQPATPGTVPEQPATRAQPALLARAVQWARQPAASVAGGSAAGSASVPDDSSLADLMATTGATALLDVSVSGRCAGMHARPAGDGRAPQAAGALRCLALAAEVRADLLVTPCFLCFGDLNHYQRHLERDDPARSIPVLHLSQVLGVACGVAPLRLGLAHATASARRVLASFVA